MSELKLIGLNHHQRDDGHADFQKTNNDQKAQSFDKMCPEKLHVQEHADTGKEQASEQVFEYRDGRQSLTQVIFRPTKGQSGHKGTYFKGQAECFGHEGHGKTKCDDT